MSDIERDEFGREIVYVSGKDIPSRPKWNKHINNLVEDGKMEKAISKDGVRLERCGLSSLVMESRSRGSTRDVPETRMVVGALERRR